MISGYYYTPSAEVSFTYYQGVFTDFAYNGLRTQVDRINNNGDLAGIEGLNKKGLSVRPVHRDDPLRHV